MRFYKQILGASFLALFIARGSAVETNGFRCETITLPANDAPLLFADLGHQGRSDLLAVDPLSRRLFVYRQRLSGFTNAPDQVLELPPQTGWISPYPVETSANLDLLLSTASGLVYYRQNGGVFESKPQTLLKVDQVFSGDAPPTLISLPTNAAIPVISAAQVQLYQRNEASSWTSGPPIALEARHNVWSGYRNAWTLGPNSAFDLKIRESFSAVPDNANDDKPENDTIAKLMAEMKKAGQWHQPYTTRVDLDGNGRKDFVLWQVLGDIDYKTDIYVFLRGADGKLPERPTQILHCRGFPIPINSTEQRSPIGDLRHDGTYELVLVEPNFRVISASGVTDMLLSHGVDMALTIRSFNHGAFSRTADASVPLTILLSWYGTGQWPFFICGDFNGDGRPDLLVQCSADQWEIFFSTNDGRWFNPRPALQFQVPTQGYFERRYFDFADLNGDGRSDLVVRDLDDPRILIFFTQSPGNP